jgi:hypothetical protein
MTRLDRRLSRRPARATDVRRARLRRVSVCAWLLVVLALPADAAAQESAARQVASAGPRFSFGGEAAVSMSPEDHGYFNYSADTYTVLRLVRIDGSAQYRPAGWLTLVGDVRLEVGIGEGGWEVRPYALFARIRPWSGAPLDIQAGIIPPVFGAFSRRAYGADNPLIGLPLGYQYVTTLRPDALPASADELLRKRGRGWLVRYPIGNETPDNGVPLSNGLRYPIGVELHAGNGRVEAGVAVTTGNLSNPDARNVGNRPQVSGRVAVRPVPGLVLGASASHGTFLTRSLTDSLGTTGAEGTNDQTGVGFDAEYSGGHWIVRTEGIYSRWRLSPAAPPFIGDPLGAFAIDVEARYKIMPGLYAAVRLDHLGFTEICGSAECLPWDAPVRRVEAGGGYSIRRNMIVKAVYQYNRRDGTFHPTQSLASVQLMVWF